MTTLKLTNRERAVLLCGLGALKTMQDQGMIRDDDRPGTIKAPTDAEINAVTEKIWIEYPDMAPIRNAPRPHDDPTYTVVKE